MTPEFRAHEASGCVDIPAPCFLCGCESHCYAKDGQTGKDVCERCCAGEEPDDSVHIDEVDNGDDYPWRDTEDDIFDYHDPYEGDAYDDGGY